MKSVVTVLGSNIITHAPGAVSLTFFFSVENLQAIIGFLVTY